MQCQTDTPPVFVVTVNTVNKESTAMNLYPAELTRAFDEVARAYATATAILVKHGPGPEYDAAADYAEAQDAALEALTDAYNALHPTPLSIPVW